jgi:hypothetical protein
MALAARGVVLPVTVTVLVLVVYCTVVQTPNTTAVTVDHMVDVVQLVVVVRMVVVTVTFGACWAKKEAPA